MGLGGLRLAKKPMHMFWLLDASGSMSVSGKMDALNAAMREAVSGVRDALENNPGVEVLVRVIAFAHDAVWHVGEAVDIEDFEWTDLAVVERGTTELGRAIELAREAIVEVAAGGRGLPPAIILVSDGKPTDLKSPSFGAALRALAEEPWGRKASRMAIGIGADADLDALQRFIGHDEIEPLLAGNADELSHYLRWASTVVVDEGTRPAIEWDELETSEIEEASEQELVPPAVPGPAPENEPTDLGPPVVDVEEEATIAEVDDPPAPPPPPGPDAVRLDPPPPPPPAVPVVEVEEAPTAHETVESEPQPLEVPESDPPMPPPSTEPRDLPPPTTASRRDLPPPPPPLPDSDAETVW